MTAPGAPRDNGPASSADGADAGPVVSGPFGRMQVIPPTVDRERLHDTLRGLAGMGDALARMNEASQHAFPNLRAGFHPAAREVAVFTDRVTGVRFPDGDDGPTLLNDLVQQHCRTVAVTAQVTPETILTLFGLSAGIVFGEPDLDANEELIRSTRGEFAYDPWEYGDREPEGPMHWTPPPEGEDVPPWP